VLIAFIAQQCEQIGCSGESYASLLLVMPVPVLGPGAVGGGGVEAGRRLRRVRSVGGPWASDSTAPFPGPKCLRPE
jgi:hypothetical protein